MTANPFVDACDRRPDPPETRAAVIARTEPQRWRSSPSGAARLTAVAILPVPPSASRRQPFACSTLEPFDCEREPGRCYVPPLVTTTRIPSAARLPVQVDSEPGYADVHACAPIIGRHSALFHCAAIGPCGGFPVDLDRADSMAPRGPPEACWQLRRMPASRREPSSTGNGAARRQVPGARPPLPRGSRTRFDLAESNSFRIRVSHASLSARAGIRSDCDVYVLG